MKLVSVRSRRVVDLADAALPRYAVLSHTRGIADQRPSPRPPTEQPSTLYNDKFAQACERALQSGVEYIWIDELCIDRESMVDLDDAVNGSRRRLLNSTICLAYLHDLPAEAPLDNDALWSRCRYWKRAWTLQELILSPRVQFYDCKWNYRGDKDSPKLLSLISSITNIPQSVLLDSTILSEISLGVRISWSVGRMAEREEDTAYALVAITKATLPVRYGEGAEQAFLHLQEELLRDTRDGSLLAWQSGQEGEVRGLLARSPSEFSRFAPAAASKELRRPWVFDGKVRLSSKGIELESRVCKGPGCLLLSIGQRPQDLGTENNIVICLREWNGVYVRIATASAVSSSALRSWHTIDVARDVDYSDSLSLRNIFSTMPYCLEIAERGGYDESWRQGLKPRVVQEHEEIIQENEDLDTEMKLDSDEVMVALTPQKSYTPSNTSDGSYLNVALTGSWMGPQEQQQHQHQHLSMDDDPLSDPDPEDALSSADSETRSLTSSSACTSVMDSAWDYDGGLQGYQRRNRELRQGENNAEVEVDAVATDTRSATTIVAEKDDRNSLENLIMQSFIREQVLETSYERVCRWISTVHYITPPKDRLPPPSRINTSDWFARPESLALLAGSASPDSEATQKQQLVPVFQPHGYFHLACPFFAADPRLHHSCVVEGQDLQSIGAVLRHVRHHHAWSPYCPRCHRDFARAEDRDSHVLERACVPAGWPAAQGDASRKGVSESEVRHLKRVDMRHRDENEVQRWWRIYWSLFPDLKEKAASTGVGVGVGVSAGGDGCGPYLRTGNGFAVSLVHDFWALRRKECVVAALEACGHYLGELNDHEALSALYQAILKELISKIYHEYHLGREAA